VSDTCADTIPVAATNTVPDSVPDSVDTSTNASADTAAHAATDAVPNAAASAAVLVVQSLRSMCEPVDHRLDHLQLVLQSKLW